MRRLLLPSILIVTTLPLLGGNGDVYVRHYPFPPPITPIIGLPYWSLVYPLRNPYEIAGAGPALAADGTFTYGLKPGLPNWTIYRRSEGGTETPLFTVPRIPLFLSRNEVGEFYVVTGGRLYVHDASGTLLRSSTISVSGVWTFGFGLGDLAPAECRFLTFDASDEFVYMWDVCQGVPLRRVRTGSGEIVTGVRALRGGGFLAALMLPGGGRALRFYDDDGRIAGEAPFPSVDQDVQAIAFDADPRFLWMSLQNKLVKVELRTGAIVLETSQLDDSWNDHIVVAGETRPSLAAASGSDIPSLSFYALAALAVILATVALHRM